MKPFLITIDGGTTNTRAVLWDASGQISCSCKAQIGVRNTAIDGDNHQLKATMKDLIGTLLATKGISIEQVQSVYVSGMATSNLGLAEIPHLVAPASLEDFVRGIQTRFFPDICPLPFRFIPGLKNLSDADICLENLETMDMMRGEETEVFALLSKLENKNGYLFVLPGSHTKFVVVDSQGKITGCLTSLTGELLSVLTNHSMISDAVKHQFAPVSYDPEFLKAGFCEAKACGCARAAFLTRIISQFITKNPVSCSSYLLGVVLQNDMEAVRNSRALQTNAKMQVIVSGKEPLCHALATLLLEDGYFLNTTVYSPDDTTPSAALGAWILASKYENF